MAKGFFKCSTCHNKQQILRCIYGTWPTPQFNELTETVQKEFMASLTENTNRTMLQQRVTRLVSSTTTNEVVQSETGAFKPLSVWEKLGYDVKVIEEMSLPEDKVPSRMFGFVYRLSTANGCSRDAFAGPYLYRHSMCNSSPWEQHIRPPAKNIDPRTHLVHNRLSWIAGCPSSASRSETLSLCPRRVPPRSGHT